MLTPNFPTLATLIREAIITDTPLSVMEVVHVNLGTILAALDLAPVGVAAIAYHDALSGSESWKAAQRMDAAIVEYKQSTKEMNNA